MEATLYLANGSLYRGKGFGAKKTCVGELVFNTSMTGYQGILTDPSYRGQIINMTYPLIGNYGVSEVDNQSGGIHAFGLVTRDISFRPSNRHGIMTIDEWLKEQGVPGVYYVDTRAITKKIRNEGTIPCVISTEGIGKDEAAALLAATPLRTDYMVEAGARSVREFPAAASGGSCVGLYNEPFAPHVQSAETMGRDIAVPQDVSALGKAGVGCFCKTYKVAILDFGIKRNIIAAMQRRGMDVWLFPYDSSAEEILSVNPDGLFLSNGPGDPESALHGIDVARQLLGKLPIFGICMGHQVLALACGAETYKLKYGHRGGNHGVCDLDTGRSAITSQNHSFAVKADNLDDKGLVVTHVNLNDGTIEGLRHKTLPMFSVQYHPEGSPGHNDSDGLFDRFIELMQTGAPLVPSSKTILRQGDHADA